MKPKNEQELSEFVKSAAANKTRLRILGGGSKAGLGNTIQTDETLDVSGLSGISVYEPGALTLVAGAGTPLSEILTALDNENQQLAFEPMNYAPLMGNSGTPTIGGIAACNISGPRRIQAGACRDSMIGVRLVDGNGEILKNGGRVMKNVTGYDLVKLMSGSFGTLGVLSEVALKVQPKPEMVATVFVDVPDDVQAVRALSSALGSPYDVTGAAYVPNMGAMVRLEGFEDMIAHRSARLQDLLSAFGTVEIETNQSKAQSVWADVRDVQHLVNKEGDLWRLSVKPSDGPAVISALGADVIDFVMDWGGGLIWMKTVADCDLRTRLHGISGNIHCLTGAAPYFPLPDPVTQKIETGLRAKFDPHGILNTGIAG